MKYIIILALLVLLPAASAMAFGVNVIMKDGTVVKGNMLGKTSDELFMDAGEGKAKSIKITDIKSIFDSDKGTPIDLSVTNNPAVLTNSSVPVQVIPGTEVRYIDYNGDVLYYYDGYWWKSWNNYWYRAYAFTGPWIVIEEDFVPYPLVYIGPRWRFYGPHFYYHYGFPHYGFRHWHRR